MTTATILPTARTVFLDLDNNPLSGGQVYFYVPNTTTFKTTWQDAGAAIPNANPVILDSNGSALIYGSGQYTQEVFDSLGNLIYTGLTQDPYGLIINGDNTFTGNNTFTGTSTFTGGFTLPNNFVTNAMLFNMAANTVKLNATASPAAPQDLAIPTNTLLGRGASNIVALTLGTGLSITGSTLNGANPLSIVVRKFTTSVAYTPTTGMKYCIAEVQAAGGSGAGVGSGGGGGAYAKKLFTASDIGASQSITIGAPGAGAGVTSVGNAGATTSLGSLLSCPGGKGGQLQTGSSPTLIALGSGTTAAPSAGDVAIPGASSIPTCNVNGPGANSPLGSGGINVIGSGAASPGLGFGAGGSPAAGTGLSGAGAPAVVLILEFCE